jgi:serine/threonine protein kinase/Flp pilus assembly protein TadD
MSIDSRQRTSRAERSKTVVTPTTPPDASCDEAVDRLVADFAARWRRGERPKTEEYLERYPELREQPEVAIELIYEEICLSAPTDMEAATHEMIRRFPQWEGQLRVLCDCHRLLESRPESPRFPIAGETLGEFHLLAELGRGAQGRVFLAKQSALADRSVVLKLTPVAGEEHLSLARLQHTHIMPLYSMHVIEQRNLRVLCMPYFGGATLSRLLYALRHRPPRQRTGQDLLRALQEAQTASPIPVPVSGVACQTFGRVSYVDAICWIGSCLADALQYAIEHGLVHLDLKPSNVLLAADGQPMLLDFHLAREPIPADAEPPGWLGGTPGYMAPEQRAALSAVRAGRPVPTAIDGRTDLYSLGVVLYESLGGKPPEGVAKRTPLYRLNPAVSVGLSDVVDKCLAEHPQDRYLSAAALAADLRRHLAHRPLQQVANRSPLERWEKWRQRRPNALTWAAVGLVAITIASAGTLHYYQQKAKAAEAFAEGQRWLEGRQYNLARATFDRGLTLVGDLPFCRGLAGGLRHSKQVAEHALEAQTFNALVDIARFYHSTRDLSPNALTRLEANCQMLWAKQDQFIQRVGPDLPPELLQQLQIDSLDLVMIWCDLQLRLALPSALDLTRQRVLRLLAQAEDRFGSSRMLCLEQQRQAAALHLQAEAQAAAERAAQHEPQSGWEHYAYGTFLFRDGKLLEALAEFDRAIAVQKRPSLWSSFYRGQCACRLGRFAEAVEAFTTCVDLAPNTAWCYHNRAIAYEGLGPGEAQQVVRDYEKAIELDKNFGPALLNRGMLYYRNGRYADAARKLEAALQTDMDLATVHYDLALVRLAQGQRDAARHEAELALKSSPKHPEARALLAALKSTDKKPTL